MEQLIESDGIEYSGEIGWVSSYRCAILDASILPLVEGKVLTDEDKVEWQSWGGREQMIDEVGDEKNDKR